MKSNFQSIIFLGLFYILSLQCGCSVVKHLKGEKEQDISMIQPGMNREVVKSILGFPSRDWTTTANIHYSIYEYIGGSSPRYADTIALAFMDLATGFLFEFFEAISDYSITKMTIEDSKIYKKLAISYDNQGKIIYVFDPFNDFDVLPADGKKQ